MEILPDMRRHTGGRQLKCEMCDAAFSHGDLKCHMRTRTSERRFKCEMCDAASDTVHI